MTEKKRGAKAPRKHNPEWADNTRKQRQDKRKAELTEAAIINGFETWSGMLTYIKEQAKRGRVVVIGMSMPKD